jgi:Na+/citrate or Na+/malate symporter
MLPWKKMNKKIVIALVSFAAFAMVVGGIGVVMAQSNSTQPATGEKVEAYYDCPGLQSGGMGHGAGAWGNMTQTQRNEIVATVESMTAAGATHAEIHAAIIAKLQEWGFEIDSTQYTGNGMMGGYGGGMMGGNGRGMMNGYSGGMMGRTNPQSSDQAPGRQVQGIGSGNCHG